MSSELKMHIVQKSAIVIAFLMITGVVWTGFARAQDVEVTEDSEETATEGSAEETEEAGATEDSDDSEETVDMDDILTIDSAAGTQSVVSNKIPLYVKIDPAIDSNRAQITWDVPRGLEVSGYEEQWFELTKGESEIFQINVKPEAAGIYTIVIDITAWQYDTNYVTSDTITFEVDENLHVTPAPAEYQTNRMIYLGTIAILLLLLGVAIALGVKFGIKWFKKWMAED